MKHLALALTGFWICCDLRAAVIVVDCYTGTGYPLRNRTGSVLSAGTAATGDGALVQLGYYSGGSLANPFSGNWVALSGPGTSYLPSSVGDGAGQVAGLFKLSFTFPTGFAGEPVIGTPLCLRFYDAPDTPAAGYFNAMTSTDGSWNWAGIGTVPQLELAINVESVGNLAWQGGAASAFRTTIPIPEPSACLLLTASAGLCIRRRRESK